MELTQEQIAEWFYSRGATPPEHGGKMKMIVTTEAGQAAAELLYPQTGNVNEITVKDGEACVFVVKVPRDGIPFYTDISKKMEDLLDHVVRDKATREKIACIVMPADQSIEHIPEAAMLRFGWKRVRR